MLRFFALVAVVIMAAVVVLCTLAASTKPVPAQPQTRMQDARDFFSPR